MRGHEPIIAMRRRGLTPVDVWFTLHETPIRCAVDWPTWTVFAFVDVQPDDAISRLDLRFAVGLVCWIEGRNADRVRALADALDVAGAKRVLWSLIEVRDEDRRMLATGDSEGVAVWQA